jgi:putative ABC transport system permease protein
MQGMRALFQDLRYGLRTLGRTPGFTLIAIVVLAVGIGANVTVFSLANTF